MALTSWATHVLQWASQRVARAQAGANPKNVLSSDRGLQPDLVKVESLVIADQNAAVNTFPGLVHTARQATKGESALSRLGNPQGN